MATVATRAAKRDLAPDWRDALREAVRRFAVRSWGVLLVGLSLGGAVALANSRHQRSLAEHSRRRTADQLARRVRRLFERRAAAPVRAWRGVPVAGDRHRRPAHDSSRARRKDRARPSARCCRRLAARNCARPHQRIFRLGPSRRLGRSDRPRRSAWRRCRARPHRQPADRGPGALRHVAAVCACRTRRRLFRAWPDRG